MEQRATNNIAPVQLSLRQLSLRLSLRQLFYFVTIAEERRFSRAAERLHISQPPLTQRIQALERDLGVQLFTRTGHQVELTEGGRLILAEVKSMLGQADRVQEVANRIRQGQMGSLRVSVRSSASFVPSFGEAIEAFRRDHPGVALNMIQMQCNAAIEALQQNKLDACVLRRLGPAIDGINEIVIVRDRMMLVLPSRHRMAAAPKVALDDVIDEPIIIYANEKTPLYKQTMGLWTRNGLAPRIILKSESGLTMLGMVAGGLGNTILPSTLSQIQAPNVVWKPIDIDSHLTSSALIMCYRATGENEKVLSKFVDCIRRFASQSDVKRN